ncbi:hypothetical protein DM872_22100 [Pseudomonas taiwanensis]|uniref:polymorphic toxin type 15 domain-containing protein n=1 Tax=Pseudomonas taiwanensis TaxID=470150 RepID=UPI0015BB52DF|nr:polymorphic toxin type 15 domain-containing protein [Pseudomonas taiwanensis]NWL79548.1 hypothetical protein [Pseudomonas taiwanensis]
MALEITVSKSWTDVGNGRTIGTFRSASGVTVQNYQDNTVTTQVELTYPEYAQLRDDFLGKFGVILPNYQPPVIAETTNPNGNTIGRVVGETPAASVAAQGANPATEETVNDKVLDGLQTGLDIVGLLPGFGEAADLANAAISLARGDYAGATLSLAAAAPFAGWLGTAGKMGRRGAKAVEEASSKTAKEAKEAPPKKAKEEAARKQDSGGKVNAKRTPKKKPECFDPRQSQAYKKMSEAEKQKYLKEYARQLKRQEDAINSMSAKEFAEARAMFERTKDASGGSGRNPLADKAQSEYRKQRGKEIESSIYESMRTRGVSAEVARAEAKAQSKGIMDKLTALHEPDMVAGGWHSPAPTGLGDKRANSAIGGSWGQKERVEMLEDAAKRAVERGDGKDMMNVELTICPPGKKGK